MSVVTLVVLVLIGLTAFRIYRKAKRRRSLSLKTWQRRERESAETWLAALGPSHADRRQAIEAMFEAGTGSASATYCAHWSGRNAEGQATTPRVIFTVSRSLGAMNNRERTFLKAAELLNSVAGGTDRTCLHWRAALVWAEGKGGLDRWQYADLESSDTKTPMAAVVREEHLTVEQTINRMQQYASSALARQDIDEERRQILSALSQAISPAGTGSWLKSADLGGSPFAPGAYPLYIGSLDDGTPLSYSGEGSMVTVAPPGSGKTQCNVFPNLLTWTGPAVVLDISGDIYEHTAAWRAQNVGPVFKFSPLEPEESHRYNPLTFVRREPDFIWEDSRLLAEMMIVPSLSSDPFWENEARTVLTAAIAHVCYSSPPEQRPMSAVLDILFGGEPWEKMIAGLRMAVDVNVMTQHATSLSAMNEKTLVNVLQTARSSLGAWAGERVARATAASDWSPADLRGPGKPTIYIYIRPNEVEAYLSLLRVFIGQHIRLLTGGAVPAHDAPPILFMLDELPRLRNMPPVDEALNIGRKYKLRLWMFAQSVGQFQAAYANADGMLSSCAVRVFMNPGGADGLAERLSEELGHVESLSDNSRRRLVEAVELSGPDYRDRQLVFAGGGRPASVSKDFAYANPELAQRMSPAPSVEPVQ